MIDVRQPAVPRALLAALELWRGKHTLAAVTLDHCVHVDVHLYAGVIGDGSNGSYEWFTWEAGQLRTSDKGYGNPCSPLCDVLMIECGVPCEFWIGRRRAA